MICKVGKTFQGGDRAGCLEYELPNEKTLSLGFLTRFDMNRAIQPEKIVRGLKIFDLGNYVAKTKALISWGEV